MTALAFEAPAAAPAPDPVSVIRTRAAADVRFLRALALAARTDGLPKAELRSANARAAARRVLDHARRLSAHAFSAKEGRRAVEIAV